LRREPMWLRGRFSCCSCRTRLASARGVRAAFTAAAPVPARAAPSPPPCASRTARTKQALGDLCGARVFEHCVHDCCLALDGQEGVDRHARELRHLLERIHHLAIGVSSCCVVFVCLCRVWAGPSSTCCCCCCCCCHQCKLVCCHTPRRCDTPYACGRTWCSSSCTFSSCPSLAATCHASVAIEPDVPVTVTGGSGCGAGVITQAHMCATGMLASAQARAAHDGRGLCPRRAPGRRTATTCRCSRESPPAQLCTAQLHTPRHALHTPSAPATHELDLRCICCCCCKLPHALRAQTRAGGGVSV
jgi:hypothetical protein